MPTSFTTKLLSVAKRSFAPILCSALLCGGAVLASCSNGGSCESSNEDVSQISFSEGFARIDASKTVELGTNEKSAKANEKPQMTVKLTYDFFIQKNEVTCAEFKEFLTADFTKKCKGENYAITDITFYDAVLFANAKSKAAKPSNSGSDIQDTAYTYTVAEFDSEGHCINLENYHFDPSAQAFRLPTEAEWTFAANANWDTDNSWNASNSNNELHEVCTADPSQKICDMAGNAMEWVNDWLGNFKDTTLENFVGDIDGGDLGKRIVKGGSYRVEPKTIKTYSRGDIYTVTSSTRADYVGFRLAYGAIPNATWLGEDKDDKESASSSSSAATSSAGASDTSSSDSRGEASSASSILNLDSAGLYYKSGGSENALYLRTNMEMMWNHRDSKLVVVGSSRSMAGVNPKKLNDSLKAINLSNIPNSIFVSEYLFKNYIIKHFKRLKYLVVALDIDMWWRNKTDSYDNFFYTEYKQFPGYLYDEAHQFWETGYPEGLAEAAHNAFSLKYFVTTYMENLGFRGEPTGAWDNEDAVVGDSEWVEKTPELYEENFKTLESIVAAARDSGITVIGAIFPMSPVYKTTGSFGRYGIRRSEAPSLLQGIADISKRYPNFVLMDENKMGDHDYTDDMAANTDHLSEKGAEHFTARLDTLVKTLD